MHFKNIISASMLCVVVCLCLTSCDRVFSQTRVSGEQVKPSNSLVGLNFPYGAHKGFGGSVSSQNKDLLQYADNGDEEAKEELSTIPSLADREKENTPAAFGSWAPPDSWRPAAALMKLREKVNSLAPSRDRKDDGMVGDYSHWQRGKASDHNPWVKDSGGLGVVTGYDITNSPSTGMDVNVLVRSLVKGKDKRIKYIIWNKQIYNSDKIGEALPWMPRPYRGANPHDKHVHISVLPDPGLYDGTGDWSIVVR